MPVNQKGGGTVCLFVIVKRIDLEIISKGAMQCRRQMVIVFVANPKNPYATAGKPDNKVTEIWREVWG
jgi:hypothetical protein